MQHQPQAARRIAVFAITSSGAVLATLDQFVVNVAFPSIGRSLHGDISSLSWVLNGYSIVFAALLVPAGRLADRNGRKAVFIIGVALFTVASLACAASSNLVELNSFRVIQAVGAAMLMPSSLGLLLAAYPDERRAAAVRAWTVVVGASAALGPVAGGLLVTVSWRWIFLINLPIGVAAIAFAARLLPATPAERGPLPDFVGAAAIALGTGALSLGLVKAQAWGWASAKTTGAWALALLLGALFLLRSTRHPCPVVELSLLRIRQFAIATTATVVHSAAYSSALLSLTLWVQVGWHWSPLLFGLGFVPGPLIVCLLAPHTGRIIGHAGLGPTAAAGCLGFAASAMIRIVLIGQTPDYAFGLLPVVLLSGLGIMLALPTLTSAATTALPPHRFATGSGFLTMGRQFGYTLGVAIAVAILGRGTNLADFQHAWMATTVMGVGAATLSLGLARAGATARAGARVAPADPAIPAKP